MQRLGIGLIGSSFMGLCHSLAFRAAPVAFDLPAQPVLEMLAEIDDEAARRAAERLGYARSTGDWRTLVADPKVDLVDIAAPNVLHKPIALAAIAAGKPVYSEKPLAPNTADARILMDSAEAAGVKTMVGFNYLKNPIVALTREIVASGEIGEVIGFRGVHAEDYMADPATPFNWRMEPAQGFGVLTDLGSHIISMARFLIGDIESVCGQLETIVKQRPVSAGAAETREVAATDQARFLVRFAGGASGSIEVSWVATGRKLQHDFEITGTRGSLAFTHERMNELKIFTLGQPAGREGYKTIVAGPDHPPYGNFLPAPGHQLGFNDTKTIEVRDLIVGLADGGAPWPDFREGWEVQRVVDAVVRSAADRSWVPVSEI